MPVYEYACTTCGRRIDVRHSIAENGPTTCEVCGGRMRKAMSTPAIHFKGSGWAKTDAQRASRAGEKKAAGDGAGDGASDSTPVAASAEGSSADATDTKATTQSDSGAAPGAKAASPSSGRQARKTSPSAPRKKSSD